MYATQAAASIQSQSWSAAAWQSGLVCGALLLVVHPQLLLGPFPVPVANFKSLPVSSKFLCLAGCILLTASFLLRSSV
ncbi:hypothetical protein [Hydrocarboniphaga effusa]